MEANNSTILITGATSGIGYEAALELLRAGSNLIILCRNQERKKQTINKLRESLTNFELIKRNLYLPIVDLGDLKTVELFVNQLLLEAKPLDRIILNAGLQYTGSKNIKWSKQNIELTFAVNHLSHFYLANKLLELLVLSPDPRVIVTSSEVHNIKSSGGRVGALAGLGNLEGLKQGIGFKMIDGKSIFNADKAYKDSKLCNILFSRELSRRLTISNTNIPVIAWAPGLVIPRSRDGFFRYSRKYNELGQIIFSFIARDLLRITETPENAGSILADIAISSTYNKKGFIYLSNQLGVFSNHKLEMIKTSDEANDQKKANILWELSNNLIEEILRN